MISQNDQSQKSTPIIRGHGDDDESQLRVACSQIGGALSSATNRIAMAEETANPTIAEAKGCERYLSDVSALNRNFPDSVPT